MSLEYRVLGLPGRDNALFVRLHTGQSTFRFLFDCGQGTVDALGRAEIQAIDHLFFSHFHVDHISGFDAFFRATYYRTSHPNIIWGPPEATEVMHARFRGFTWNLQEGMPGRWHVHAIHPQSLERSYADLGDAFSQLHYHRSLPFDGTLLDEAEFSIQAVHLDHAIPSIGYLLREKPRLNIDPDSLQAMGLRPGPWLQAIKHPGMPDEPRMEIEGRMFDLDDLRRNLLRETLGESIAYLTDFLMTEEARRTLVEMLKACTVLVCESTYRRDDTELADRNFHLTSTQAAELARDAGVHRLVLIHVSDRYRPEEWMALLEEAREVFPATSFPEEWKIRPADENQTSDV